MGVSRPNLPEGQSRELKLPAVEPPPPRPRAAKLRPHQAVVMSAGIGLALLVSIGGSSVALWGKIRGSSSPQSNSALSFAISDRDLDRQRPQKQAEILLERAVSHSHGVTNQSDDQAKDRTETQIAARIDAWRGQLQWDSQLGDLTTVALNSNDQRLRDSAVEVQLAAYGLTKSQSSVDALVRQADSRDHAQAIWALWTLGLLGNRGVETDRVVQVLAAHLKPSGSKGGEDGRRWAVEGLALVGTTATIPPLLEAMRSDPSATVRERAACNLAESGMLSHDQRLIAVPQLIDDSSDPTLDAQTHALSFLALAAITQQRLPNDPAAWRNWYQTTVTGAR